MLGRIEGRRRSGQQGMRWLDGISDSISGHESEQTLGDIEGQRSLMVLQSMGSQRVSCDLVMEQQQSFTQRISKREQGLF